MLRWAIFANSKTNFAVLLRAAVQSIRPCSLPRLPWDQPHTVDHLRSRIRNKHRIQLHPMAVSKADPFRPHKPNIMLGKTVLLLCLVALTTLGVHQLPFPRVSLARSSLICPPALLISVWVYLLRACEDLPTQMLCNLPKRIHRERPLSLRRRALYSNSSMGRFRGMK